MAKETVLVTGGAGRLGRALTGELLRKGMDVRVLVQSDNDAVRIPAGVAPYVGDITDERALIRACRGVDMVFHLAAIVSQFREGPHEIMRTNAMGTRRVMEAARHAKARKVIFASTVNVYGRVRKELLTEESEPKPTDTYGLSKVVAEKEIMGSGMNYTILRMATIYGPGFENSFLKVFKAIKEGKAYIIGSGKNHLPLVHINDAVSAFMLAASKKVSDRKTYNITDGREYTQEYLFNLAADLLGVPKPDKHISPLVVNIVAKARGLDRDEIRFVTSDKRIDISKAKKELGFRPKESVESGAGYLLNRFLMYHESYHKAKEEG